MAEKKKFLDLKSMLRAVDKRDKDWYNRLSDDDKKLFAPFIAMRYVSSVKSDTFFQEHYLEMCNEFVNKHHWTLSKNHKGLLWKLMSMCGAYENFFHQYIAAPKKQTKNKFTQTLLDKNPTMKQDDAELLSTIMSKTEQNQYIKEHDPNN
tara:strand:- start:970 stop:1419 length:450 start_codon:yes stop_codon:yes gene_type:complete